METTAPRMSVAAAPAAARQEFLRQTYLHLAFAFFAFLTVESFLLRWADAMNLAVLMIDGFNWLIVLALFAAVTGAADRMARSTSSLTVQYAGLGITILAEAAIFLPIMLFVQLYGESTTLRTAVVMTLVMVIALTAVALFSGADFSFLRSMLCIGGILAFAAIVASIAFGFGLGLGFSVIMVIFASGVILYQTSNVMKNYRSDQYVAASVALFSAVTLLFWYVLRIVGFSSND